MWCVQMMWLRAVGSFLLTCCEWLICILLVSWVEFSVISTNVRFMYIWNKNTNALTYPNIFQHGIRDDCDIVLNYPTIRCVDGQTPFLHTPMSEMSSGNTCFRRIVWFVHRTLRDRLAAGQRSVVRVATGPSSRPWWRIWKQRITI